jgi:hypothetical protein
MVYFVIAFLTALILAPHGALEFIGVMALAMLFAWLLTDRKADSLPRR